MSSLAIKLLGGFQLIYNGRPIAALHQTRLQSLLAYLIFHCDAPQSRQQLAFLFWPDSTERQARTNLRKAILQLRRALPDAERFLVVTQKTLQWQPSAPFTVDVAKFESKLRLAQSASTTEQRRRQIANTIDLYAGELLPDSYDDWLLVERERLHHLFIGAIEQVIELFSAASEYDRAIEYAQRLLRHDPLHEVAYRHLMQLHSQNGNRARALHIYHECAALLERELGVAPAPATHELYARLLQSTSDRTDSTQTTSTPLPATFPPTPHTARPTVKAKPAYRLVGRDHAWQRLQACWTSASQRRAHLVLITGEAGIGKTRLAEELLFWAERQGIHTARTRAFAAEGRLAYAPIAEWLGSAAIWPVLAQLEEVWLTELARLLPEILAERPQLVQPQPMTDRWQQQRFYAALVESVLALREPLILLLDDLQWCDDETLAWLHYLLHFAQGDRGAAFSHHPLLIVGTLRVGEIDAAHPLNSLLSRLSRDDHLTEIELARLNKDETQALASQVAEQTLDNQTTERLFDHTIGNPLFVVESVRAGLTTDDDQTSVAQNEGGHGHTVSIPPKVYSVLQTRLANLSSLARDIASIAAVNGRSFTYELLVTASDHEEDGVVNALDELWQRRIIREAGNDAYDFSHDRIRDVAYAEISTIRRRLLHRRVAQALEQLYAGNLEKVSGALAEHYAQAGHLDRAVDYLVQAGRRAEEQYANRLAVEYFTRTLALIPPTEIFQRFEILLARERLFEALGQSDARIEDLNAMHRLVEASELESSQTDRMRFWVSIRWSYWCEAQAEFAQAMHFAQDAVRLAQACGEATLEAEAYRRCGNIYFTKGDMLTARREFEQALPKARAVKNLRNEAESLEWLGAIGMYTGLPIGKIVGYFDQAMSIAQEINDLVAQRSIYNKIGYALVAQGEDDYQQAETQYRAGIELSHQIGAPIFGVDCLRNLGLLYTSMGEYAKAENALLSAQELLQGKNLTFEATGTGYIGLNYLHAGSFIRAQLHLERALQSFELVEKTRPHRTVVLHGLSLLHTLLREYEIARDYAKQALQFAEERGDDRHAAYASTCLGHALLGLGKLDEASACYQQARTLHLAMEQVNRSMEPLAGLAQIAILTHDLAEAQGFAKEILAHILVHPLNRTEDAFLVYWTCYGVLRANRDARAAQLLQITYQQLQHRAGSLQTAEEQALFWRMNGHQEVFEAYHQAH